MNDHLEQVRERYATAARRAAAGEGTGLLAGAGDTDRLGAVHYDADTVPEHVLATSLGCGNPLAVAELREGETVLDLGSGGGLDVLLSARRVGPTGRAIGLDTTDEMLTLARGHATGAGIGIAEFLAGRIEDIPLPDNSVDVVISNCVIALFTDKTAVFTRSPASCAPAGAWASPTSSPTTPSPTPNAHSAPARSNASPPH